MRSERLGGVGVRKRDPELVDGEIVGEQAIAPALRRGELGPLGARDRLHALQRGADRLRVHVAHQAPDELHLPAPRFVLGDRSRLRDGVGEALGQVERLEPRRIERDQLHAQILERVHVPLAPGFRRRLRTLRCVRGDGGVQRTIGRCGHGNRREKLLCYHSPRPQASPRTARVGNPETDDMTFPLSTPVSSGTEVHGRGGGADGPFPVSTDALASVADRILVAARKAGATAAETDVSQAVGQSVTVREGEVETIAYNRDKGIGVTVYVGQRRGHASTADFGEASIQAAVDKAVAIARFTAEDPAAGLADADRLAKRWADLDLYHPWALSVDQAIDLGREAERAALAVDKRITNTEGATVSRGDSEFVYANSNGFIGGYRGSRHHIDASVIGEDDAGMQRDYWYTAARVASELMPAAEVGRIAGERTARRLNARKLGTLECPVLFEAPEAADLIGSFVHAVSGGSLYRKASFLQDALGTAVFSPVVSIREEPHLPRARGSAPFDAEGVATLPRDVIRGGVLEGYFLGSYSARKLGMTSTANAGGAHNLVVSSGDDDFAQLVKRLGRGLIVTEQLGHGVNLVTGDYSRGVAGFWVEGGEIAYPVEEITIAGNLRDIFRGIVAVGRDVDRRGSRHVGSILVDRMMVAGQ